MPGRLLRGMQHDLPLLQRPVLAQPLPGVAAAGPAMKCAMCGRPLTLPTVAIPTRAGPMAYGPVCAKRAGLIRHKERARKARPAVHRVDERQADWVRQAQEGRRSVDGAVFGVGVVHG